MFYVTVASAKAYVPWSWSTSRNQGNGFQLDGHREETDATARQNQLLQGYQGLVLVISDCHTSWSVSPYLGVLTVLL